MERGNLPFRTFPGRPLTWGTEPTPPPAAPSTAAPANGSNLTIPAAVLPVRSVVSVSFGARVTGAAGTYPIANRIATQGFTTAIGLLTASLSTSVVNATTDTPMLIVIARDVGANLNVLAGNDILVTHAVEQGLSHSMRSGVGFADDIAPKYGSGQNIGIYLVSSGTGVAGNAATAVAVLRYYSLA